MVWSFLTSSLCLLYHKINRSIIGTLPCFLRARALNGNFWGLAKSVDNGLTGREGRRKWTFWCGWKSSSSLSWVVQFEGFLIRQMTAMSRGNIWYSLWGGGRERWGRNMMRNATYGRLKHSNFLTDSDIQNTTQRIYINNELYAKCCFSSACQQLDDAAAVPHWHSVWNYSNHTERTRNVTL